VTTIAEAMQLITEAVEAKNKFLLELKEEFYKNTGFHLDIMLTQTVTIFIIMQTNISRFSIMEREFRRSGRSIVIKFLGNNPTTTMFVSEEKEDEIVAWLRTKSGIHLNKLGDNYLFNEF
jgi:hypothetical protein